MKKYIAGIFVGLFISVSSVMLIFDFNVTRLVNLLAGNENILIVNEGTRFKISYNELENIENYIKEENKVLEAVNSFLKQKNNKLAQLSSNLQKKVSEGEFKLLKSKNIFVKSIDVYNWTYIDDNLYSYIVDLVLQTDNGYQWLQLKTLWDPEERKIYDLDYKPIEYFERLNSDMVNEQGLKIAEEILVNLNNPNPKLMGWKYKKTDNPGQNGVNDIKVLDITPLGSYLSENDKEPKEMALKAHYRVKVFEKINEIESLLYLKNYAGNWQLEDIKVIEIKETESSS